MEITLQDNRVLCGQPQTAVYFMVTIGNYLFWASWEKSFPPLLIGKEFLTQIWNNNYATIIFSWKFFQGPPPTRIKAWSMSDMSVAFRHETNDSLHPLSFQRLWQHMDYHKNLLRQLSNLPTIRSMCGWVILTPAIINLDLLITKRAKNWFCLWRFMLGTASQIKKIVHCFGGWVNIPVV